MSAPPMVQSMEHLDKSEADKIAKPIKNQNRRGYSLVRKIRAVQPVVQVLKDHAQAKSLITALQKSRRNQSLSSLIGMP